MAVAEQPDALRSVRVRAMRWMGAVLLAMLAACASETRAITQLVLVADTDMAELDTVSFTMTSPTGEQRTAQGPVAPGQPAFVTMVKSGDAALGPYRVQVDGTAGGQVLVSRIADVSFVRGKTRAALLHLARTCSAAIACPAEQVCALGECRARAIAQAELVSWDGQPPRLVSSNGLDAGLIDDGSATDGGVDRELPNDATIADGVVVMDDASDDGGACSSAQPRCQGELLELCSNGVVTGTMACAAGMDPCTRNACVPGKGCTPVPVQTNVSCGASLVCRDGVCGGGQSCTSTCNATCTYGVTACEIGCPSGGQDCNANCPQGSQCTVYCAGSNNCNGSCLGNCDVSCEAAKSCRILCQAGSTCDIDCTGKSKCDQIACQAGASCILRCGTDNNCKIALCPGGSITDCGDGVFTCRASCPP